MRIDGKTLRAELCAVNAEATAICEGLMGEQLAWRPDPAKWSIAENLIHLCTSYVKMNLLEFFAVFNGHSRRHLWQAANVRRGLPNARS